jgi:excisionase family DNA binding protein
VNTQTPTRDGSVLLTQADAARLANVSRDTIYREIDRGALPVGHVGRLLRINPYDFRSYLERNKTATRGDAA